MAPLWVPNQCPENDTLQGATSALFPKGAKWWHPKWCHMGPYRRFHHHLLEVPNGTLTKVPSYRLYYFFKYLCVYRTFSGMKINLYYSLGKLDSTL